MYTFESSLFTKEFKEAATKAISIARAHLTPEDFLTEVGNRDEAESVMTFGHRWKSDEQCFQAMIMRVSQMFRDVRGPGMLTEEEAQSFERDLLGHTMEFVAKEGILSAIGCDQWYMFEKQWE